MTIMIDKHYKHQNKKTKMVNNLAMYAITMHSQNILITAKIRFKIGASVSRQIFLQGTKTKSLLIHGEISDFF